MRRKLAARQMPRSLTDGRTCLRIRRQRDWRRQRMQILEGKVWRCLSGRKRKGKKKGEKGESQSSSKPVHEDCASIRNAMCSVVSIPSLPFVHHLRPTKTNVINQMLLKPESFLFFLPLPLPLLPSLPCQSRNSHKLYINTVLG